MYIDNNNNSGSSAHTTHVVSLATTASSPSSSSDVWSSWAARLLLLLVLLCHAYALTSRWRGHARRVCAMCATCTAALCVVVAVVLAALYCLDAFALLAQLRHIVTAPDTSLTTAAGLAVVSRRVRALAQTRQTQQRRRQQAPPQLLLLLALVYVTLQALCVPGTLVLNVVAGALVGVRVALPLCVALGTAGAVACYALSRCVGARLVAYMDARRTGGRGVAALRARVAQHRRELFVYMLFLRLTPVLPNGLVNVASPIAHVPLSTFAAATAVGIAPQTYLAVRFGALAHTLQQQQQQQQEERGLDDSSSSSNTLHVTTTTPTRIVTATDTLLLAVLGATCVLVVHLKRRFAT